MEAAQENMESGIEAQKGKLPSYLGVGHTQWLKLQGLSSNKSQDKHSM